MIICNSTNVTIQTSDSGLIFLTNNCQLVQTDGNQTDNGTISNVGELYDSSGAMTYMVAVMVLYAVAVVGVFALSFIRRRKKYSQNDDKEAQTFIKNIDHVRNMSEKKFRVGTVAALLEQVHADSKSKNIVKGASFLNNFALVTMSMADIEEDSDSAEKNKRSEDVIYDAGETCSSIENLDGIIDGSMGINVTALDQHHCSTGGCDVNIAKETWRENKTIVPEINQGIKEHPYASTSNSVWSLSNTESTIDFFLADSDLNSSDNEVFLSDDTDEFYDVFNGST